MILDFIYAGLFVQGFFVALVLLVKGGKQVVLLSLLSLMVSYEILTAFILPKTIIPLSFYIYVLRELFGFLYGPFLLMFVRRLTGTISFQRRDLIFYIPFALYFALVLFSILIRPIHSRQFNFIICTIKNGVIVVSLIISLITLIRYRLSQRGISSLSPPKNIVFVERLLWPALFAALIGSAANLFEGSYPLLFNSLSPLAFFFLGLIIYSISYRALLSSDFMHSTCPAGQPVKRGGGKYRKDLIPEAVLQEHLKHIADCVSAGSLYLEAGLTLPRLASITGLSVNDLSQVINIGSGMNFYSFINEYRLMHARQLLTDASVNILNVAFASGFNSKSSFNSLFKKRFGVSPSQYRRNFLTPQQSAQ